MAAYTVGPDGVPRDRWGRPLVIPPEGGEPVAYTRCTSYIDVLDDKFNLQQWEKRQVALGLVQREDLRLAVISHRDDKKQLNKIADQAKEAARSSAAATTGTAVHKLTEDMDAGLPIPDYLPDEAKRDLDAYRQATAELHMVMAEQFHVLDSLRIGGTPDRIVAYRGRYYISDLKTGQIDFGAMKIAMQLGVYSRAVPYSFEDGVRIPRPFTVETDRAIVVHLPAGSGKCELRWVDIGQGWDAVQTASQVREWRKVKNWYEPFGDPVTVEETPATDPDAGLLQRIEDAATVDSLREVWFDAQLSGALTERLEAVMHARKAVLEG